MDLPCENLQGRARVPTPAVSPAVNLSQNLLSMEIEKPVKWIRDKAKVSQNITYPNLVPAVFII